MKTWQWIAIGTGAAALVTLIVVKRKKIQTVVMNTVWDAVTEARINDLHPAIRQRTRNFIAAAERQGMKLRITSGKRTFPEQQKLYDQGRTASSIAKGEKIVTNAKPGASFHNYALGFDVVEIKDGQGLWDNPNWSKIGALGKSFGFEWGGEWTSFKDLPHFEYPPGKSVSQLRAMYDAGNVDSNGYLTQIT